MNSKVELIASGISNLTDARYFAAMGVQWMTFDLTREPRLAVEQMHAIMDWVEGPAWLLEMNAHEAIPVEGTTGIISEQAPPDGSTYVYIQRVSDIRDVTSSRVFLDLAKYERVDTDVIRSLDHQADELWILAPWSPALIEAALDNDKIGGIVFAGGDEDAVGIRNFDQLDQLFELIEDYRH